MTTLKDVTAQEAHALLSGNAVLVDVREPHEQAIERIAGSLGVPLSVLSRGAGEIPKGKTAVFLCASGARTRNNARALAALADGEAFNLAGGIMAWKRAGLPTVRG